MNPQFRRQSVRRVAQIAVATAAVGAALPLAACRGDRTEKPPRQFFPDMDEQRSWQPQEATTFFENGRTQRTPVDGTVAYGRSTWNYEQVAEKAWGEPFVDERPSLLRENDAVWQGLGPDGQVVERIPIEVDEELIATGKEQFNINCAVCHGYTGRGNGTVGLYWNVPITNIVEGIYTDRSNPQGTDGHIFRTILYGVGDGPIATRRMPGYVARVTEHEAWAVVAYVRVLQAAQNASLESLTADERRALEATRTTAPGAEPPPAEDAEGAEQPAGETPTEGQPSDADTETPAEPTETDGSDS